MKKIFIWILAGFGIMSLLTACSKDDEPEQETIYADIMPNTILMHMIESRDESASFTEVEHLSQHGKKYSYIARIPAEGGTFNFGLSPKAEKKILSFDKTGNIVEKIVPITYFRFILLESYEIKWESAKVPEPIFSRDRQVPSEIISLIPNENQSRFVDTPFCSYQAHYTDQEFKLEFPANEENRQREFVLLFDPQLDPFIQGFNFVVIQDMKQ